MASILTFPRCRKWQQGKGPKRASGFISHDPRVNEVHDHCRFSVAAGFSLRCARRASSVA